MKNKFINKYFLKLFLNVLENIQTMLFHCSMLLLHLYVVEIGQFDSIENRRKFVLLLLDENDFPKINQYTT